MFKKIVLILIFFCTNSVFAFEIIDMAGRKVNIPKNIQRVYSVSPPITLLQYILAPKTLIATSMPQNFNLFNSKSGYIDKTLDKLPSLGGWHNSSKGVNIEALLALKPQLILAWKDTTLMSEVEATFKPYNIPVVFLSANSIDDEIESIRLLGKILFVEPRANILANDAKVRLDYVKQLAQNQTNKPIIYYALGIDGLTTECYSSFHYEPFRYVGVKQAFVCEPNMPLKAQKISIEEIIQKNPDIIVIKEESFFKTVKTDAKWQSIKAVKNNKVFLIPNDPINFIDRPPTFMRILGVEWLASTVKPELFKKNINDEVHSFYKLYLSIELNKQQIENILK